MAFVIYSAFIEMLVFFLFVFFFEIDQIIQKLQSLK